MKQLCKQVRDQIVWKQFEDIAQCKGCYGMEINSKAFAVPILTASDFVAAKIGIANTF